MQLKLFNHVWTVNVSAELPCDAELGGKDAEGHCDYEKHVITLRAGLPQERLNEVLIHECIHAVHFTMDIDMKEQHVRLLGLGLAQLLEPFQRPLLEQ